MNFRISNTYRVPTEPPGPVNPRKCFLFIKIYLIIIFRSLGMFLPGLRVKYRGGGLGGEVGEVGGAGRRKSPKIMVLDQFRAFSTPRQGVGSTPEKIFFGAESKIWSDETQELVHTKRKKPARVNSELSKWSNKFLAQPVKNPVLPVKNAMVFYRTQ